MQSTTCAQKISDKQQWITHDERTVDIRGGGLGDLTERDNGRFMMDEYLRVSDGWMD